MTCNDFVEMIAEKSRENMNVYLSVLIELAMFAQEMEQAEKIVLDGSSEMEEALKEIAQEFTTEHFAPQTVDKAAHWASLYCWAEGKLIDAFAEKHSYRVDFSCSKGCHVYVEAADEEAAKRIAKEMIHKKGVGVVEFDDDTECEIETDYCYDVILNE